MVAHNICTIKLVNSSLTWQPWGDSCLYLVVQFNAFVGGNKGHI